MDTAYLDTLITTLEFQVRSSEDEVRSLSGRLSDRLRMRHDHEHPVHNIEIQGMGSMIDVASARLQERRDFLKLLEALKGHTKKD